MDEKFRIYIDRLALGNEEEISLCLPSDFLDIHEAELTFIGDVSIEGKAYLAEEHLIIYLDIEATCSMPCSFCNEIKIMELSAKEQYFTIPLAEINGKTYNFLEDAREAILLETPSYYQCQGDTCPAKNELKKYLKQPSTSNCPFADLESQKGVNHGSTS
jgi:hypothetical protein